MSSEWNPLVDELSTLAKESQSSQSKRRRQKMARGLPDRATLLEMAETYLEVQRELWPELVKQKLLPKPTPAVLESMALDFERCFRAGELQGFDSAPASGRWKQLAAAYTRFSDPNSNPRSLAQQLRNILVRAHQDGAFIPWAFVFADAAITGTIASRRSYQMTKELLRLRPSPVESFYIDEIGRASRDTIEALILGRLITDAKKRMIGVTDGFDSAKPHSNMLLTLFAMLQQWFVEQLRSKVNRGMDDAFRQGSNIHGPCVGYRLVPVRDQHGAEVLDNTGNAILTKEVAEEEAAYVRLAFELFVHRGWPRRRIALLFNENKVGGLTSWDTSTIGQLIARETYVGRECYRMTTSIVNSETGEKTIIRRPREEWLVREMPHLRIISDELWEAAQKRRKEVAEAYSKNGRKGPRRGEVYPRSLFQLVCGCCGELLRLGRGGTYASYCCPNGIDRKQNCSFAGYKSVRIVESAILDHLRANLFTDEFLDRLVDEANQYLAKLAQEPRKDISPLKGEIRRKQAALKRIMDQLGERESDDLGPVFDKVAQLKRAIDELQARLSETEMANQGPPPPLTKAVVAKLLDDLRGLLETEPETAAPALAALVGKIVVEQTDRPSKRGKAWLARFTVNSVPVLASLAAHTDCPATSALELLRRRNWTISFPAEVLLENVPPYVLNAPRAASLAKKGADVSAIARALGISWDSAKNSLEFVQSGQRPKPQPPRKPARRSGQPPREPKYKQLAPLVAELRDKQLSPFNVIAKRLGTCASTIARAYDWFHRDAMQVEVELGNRPNRGRHVRIGAEKYRQIRRLIDSGMNNLQISETVGCGTSTVDRERKKLAIDCESVRQTDDSPRL